jgi:hypothetical protein
MPPLDKNDIDNRFTFHPVTGDEQAEKYAHIRGQVRDLAHEIVATCPPSRELSLAITHLEESVFWANAAIARHDEKGERIG